ncbi:MAG: hypothetical protein EP332_06555 [Bacteroidetes bacterium]|nr:MAG: hypothetical protein EP332_06555 [Bacteroidota bacterium]
MSNIFYSMLLYHCIGELIMKDIIQNRLKKAVDKKQVSAPTLQRYFKVHYKINLSPEALQNRLDILTRNLN